MATCEMCGKEASVHSTKVASSIMQLCKNCSKYGEDYSKNNNNNDSNYKVFKKKKTLSTKEVITSDYSSKISNALQEKGYNTHQLARAINLKESSLHKFLTGKIQPEIDTAKKIGNFLEISLVFEEDDLSSKQDYILDDEEESQGTSLGDLLKEKLNK